MNKPLVTGGTGFIGKRLCALLPPPNVLTRSPEKAPRDLSGAACFRWIPDSEAPPPEALDGCDAVFHLARRAGGGGPVDGGQEGANP